MLILSSIWLNGLISLLIIFFILFVFIFLVEVSLNLDDNVLELTCGLASCLIIDTDFELSQFDVVLEIFHALNLNLDNKEVLLPDSIIVWIYRALKHLKESLSLNFESLLSSD